MNPAWSVIFFTTLSGAAQGLVVMLAAAMLAGADLQEGFARSALVVAFVLLVGGLGASFAHLGRPERAWRAATMWRTSWLSREVIVLPTFTGIVALWWLAMRIDADSPWSTLWLPLAALAVAALLWYCTAMIYACLRFIQEWAHPLTIVNYVLIGLSSGFVLAGALACWTGEADLAATIAPFALAATLAAWAMRLAALRRNARIRHASTLQTATGIASARLVQRSMGFTAGSFNTREFFHGVKTASLRRIKLAALLLGFAAPALLLFWTMLGGAPAAWLVALPLQAAGVLADRWFFFAQAKHPQNLYYQVVS